MVDTALLEQDAPSWFYRWGPYVLLVVSAGLAAATVEVLMTPTTVRATGVLVAAALLWQLGWDRRLRVLPERSPGRVVYFAVRTALAAVLSCLNPFFSVFTVMGYFDAREQLPPALRRYGLLTVAATMAIAQSSGGAGPLPHGITGWTIFAGLFSIHAALALSLERFTDRQAAMRREQRETIEALRQALAENEALHAQLVQQAREAGVADERRRLAAEIHDTLAQGLAGIVTQLQAATDSRDEATARAHVARAAALARYSLGEARRSVHNLTPGPLEHHALPEALRKAVAHWSAGSPARLEVTVTGTEQPLHGEVEATLLRIAEEAVGNAVRHAAATRIGVTLSYLDDEVTLDVRDDGRGFDPRSPAARSVGGGFGLPGMRARAARVAGRVEIESEPGGGTAVSVRVPLVNDD